MPRLSAAMLSPVDRACRARPASASRACRASATSGCGPRWPATTAGTAGCAAIRRSDRVDCRARAEQQRHDHARELVMICWPRHPPARGSQLAPGRRPRGSRLGCRRPGRTGSRSTRLWARSRQRPPQPTQAPRSPAQVRPRRPTAGAGFGAGPMAASWSCAVAAPPGRRPDRRRAGGARRPAAAVSRRAGGARRPAGAVERCAGGGVAPLGQCSRCAGGVRRPAGGVSRRGLGECSACGCAPRWGSASPPLGERQRRAGGARRRAGAGVAAAWGACHRPAVGRRRAGGAQRFQARPTRRAGAVACRRPRRRAPPAHRGAGGACRRYAGVVRRAGWARRRQARPTRRAGVAAGTVTTAAFRPRRTSDDAARSNRPAALRSGSYAASGPPNGSRLRQVPAALRPGSAVLRLRFPRLRRCWLALVRHAVVS